MQRPQVSWLPARYINSALDAGYPSLERWFTEAYVLGLRYVELYYALLPSTAPEIVRAIRKRLDRHELGVSMLTCAPDFVHPDSEVRERHYREMLTALDVAKRLGATGLRVTTGCRHPQVPVEDGLIWCTEHLRRLGEAAERMGLKLGLENHYRDRRWQLEDFAHHTELFLQVFERLKDSPVGINFDTSNALVSGGDPMTILEVVKSKVWHVHASDRFPGQQTHTPVGEGAVDFDSIFRCLSAIGYQGFISFEDAAPGNRDSTARGLHFLRAKIAQWWR